MKLSDGTSHMSYRFWSVRNYQVANAQTLLGWLNDSAPTTLANTGLPFGPGDAAVAIQFGPLDLAPSGAANLEPVSVLFNSPRDHVKGDLGGLGLPTLAFEAPDLTGRRLVYMRRNQGSNATFNFWDPSGTAVAGLDDFNGDLKDEVVSRHPATGVAYVADAQITGAPTLPLNWKLSATGDFDADGKADILWRNTTSQKLVIWTMNGNAKVGSLVPTPDQAVDANWEVAAAADFSGDGHRDLLWYNQTSGKIVLWFMDASVARLTGQFTNPATVGNNNWKVLAVGDYGKGPGGQYDTQDIVWQNDTSKKTVIWYLDLARNRTSGTFTYPDTIENGKKLVGPR